MSVSQSGACAICCVFRCVAYLPFCNLAEGALRILVSDPPVALPSCANDSPLAPHCAMANLLRHVSTGFARLTRSDGVGGSSATAADAFSPSVGEVTHEAPEAWLVSINLFQGRRLLAADKAITGNSSDPYVRIAVQHEDGTVSDERKSKLITKCLDPVYNERFEFVCFAKPASVKFTVMDFDRGSKDDALGMS